ncbi:hypothetical protein GJAV_G00169990 [Gymnothorax javanicus]|nr:hypothetical protein GJAV_G00169990 [Gymnothorax javanicus]
MPSLSQRLSPQQKCRICYLFHCFMYWSPLRVIQEVMLQIFWVRAPKMSPTSVVGNGPQGIWMGNDLWLRKSSQHPFLIFRCGDMRNLLV